MFSKEEESLAFKNKEEAVSFVNTQYTDRKKKRQPVELQWMLNMNFLMGNQFCDINATRNQIQQINYKYDWEEHEVYNQIAPIYEARCSKLVKIRPETIARPASSEAKDISAAEISTLVAKSVDVKECMRDKRSDIVAWMELCNVCFVKHIWNDKDGRTVGIDSRNNETVYEGDINKIVVNGFEVLPENLLVEGIERQKSIIHAKAYPIEEIEERWGKKVKSEKVDVFTLDQSNSLTNAFGSRSTVHTYIQTSVEGYAIVKEFISIPCRKFPKGIVMVVAGNELLEYQEIAYFTEDKGKPGLPWEMYVSVKCPGHFFGPAIIERLIPVQRAYNATRNRKHDALNRKAIGILALEDDGNLDTEDLENEGLSYGKILPYQRGGTPPRIISDNTSLTDFDTEIKQLENEFERISGVSIFSIFSATPSGTSGKALEKIKENDDSKVGLARDNIYNAAIRSSKIDLRMYKQFAKGPRLLQMAGEGKEALVQHWFSSDLSADDIIIDQEDALAMTPAQRQDMVIQLLQYRILDKDADPKLRLQLLKLLQFGDWENISGLEELHRNKAMRENQIFLQNGVIGPPDSIDDATIHVPEHNRLRLGVDYEELRRTNPQVTDMFAQHVLMHEQKIAEKLQQTMMMAQVGQKQAQ
jgi:hypothetical protein